MLVTKLQTVINFNLVKGNLAKILSVYLDTGEVRNFERVFVSK